MYETDNRKTFYERDDTYKYQCENCLCGFIFNVEDMNELVGGYFQLDCPSCEK